MYTKYEQWVNEAKLESFKTKEEVQNWLDTMSIKNYTINKLNYSSLNQLEYIT